MPLGTKWSTRSAQSHLDAEPANRMTRFKYVCELIGFDSADIKALHLAAPMLAPLVEKISCTIFERLIRNDLTKSKFGEHNEDIKIDSEVIIRRRQMLTIYFIKLFTANYDEEFITVCLSHSNF
jgi:hypothetical protein